ncbi:MAG: class I SAM-dependent methyltransferase [Bacteroidetes bacterium]|nr:class I SAM-dependent methyltransferase [Bacteroidota bacterium]
MSINLDKQVNRDILLWDNIADESEKSVLSGHPDIIAYENFEEQLLDKILMELTEKGNKPIKLVDICTGAGRIPEHYHNKIMNEEFPFNLNHIHGIDISKRALEMAESKLSGMDEDIVKRLNMTFELGSAFDLKEENDLSIPILVNLNNSIGTLQGYEGAQQLFISMRKAVEKANGIGIISCYSNNYIEDYALNIYESAMQVTGQPQWLEPTNYTSSEYKMLPKELKAFGNLSKDTYCDIYDQNGLLAEEDYKLTRAPTKVRAVNITGNIKTYRGYSSMWYSPLIINQWINSHWNGCKTYYIETKDLDEKLAPFGQLAILDCGNHLNNIF